MKILICGHRAYAARNLVELLESKGHEVVCFSRGEQKRKGKIVTGKVLEVDKNPYLLEEKVDVIINFILMEGASHSTSSGQAGSPTGVLEDNLQYTEALCRLAEKVGAKKLIHMSSISCYANDEKLITERTAIDAHPECKGGYGAVKVQVDNLLLNRKMATKVVMMRPGFITAPDKKNALAGIAKMLPGGFAVLMGNKESTLPLCERDDLHKAMLDAIEKEEPKKVYLLVGDGKGTKYSYLKTIAPNAKVIPLPMCLVVGLAKVLKAVHVFDERKYQMVKGQFKVQRFG